ncbi:MAG: hypothetical protein FJ104_07920, partial [Deltaproteobacteria bacterium]|nr:hypothetical protein [Deltaproteobacteria bacterium]
PPAAEPAPPPAPEAELLPGAEPPAPAPTADAAFGGQWQATFSVWRLYGISVDSAEVQTGVDPQSGAAVYKRLDSTTVSLLGTDAPLPYGVPRLAGDLFVLPNLSVGGAAMYVRRTLDGKDASSVLVLTPRIGYGTALSDLFSIWVLGGMTYSRRERTVLQFASGSAETRSSQLVETGLAATLDAMLIVTPRGPFGFLVGPAADIGFGGNKRTASSTRTYGLLGGLVAWLPPPWL